MRKRPQNATISREDEPVRAIIYTRLSKAKSGETRADVGRNTEVSLQTQEDTCRRHVETVGGTVVGVESDIISGDRLEGRVGLWAAIDRIRDGTANTLVVHSLERLSRSSDQCRGLISWLGQANGRLVSATEPNIEGEYGAVMREMLMLAGSVEVKRTRERTNRALHAKFAATGRYKPGFRPPYGFGRVGSGADASYEIDPRESAVLTRMFTERAAGASLRSIILGLQRNGITSPAGRAKWSTAGLTVILAREGYATGQHEVWTTRTVRDTANVPFQEARPAEERYFVSFPPLITPDLFVKAQLAKERNKWSTRRADRPAEYGLLRYGYARCAGCNRALSVIPSPRGGAR